ncbi:MAG TPA: cysteine desulfurase [Polyangiaceae bacterium]|jgi:cysteine desulfurase/selenocysteine lyase|nr:cysteine desulfurase [Polyangiaceae bacterium]
MSDPGASWRRDFPALAEFEGTHVAYWDSAATAQKPQAVLDAVVRHYQSGVGNAHRGVHRWAERTTEAYESARANVARFVGAAAAAEIVFTRNGTEALNLLASAVCVANVRARPRVVVSEIEHHSNLVPWQALCRLEGAELVIAPVDERGELDLEQLETLVDERTALVAVCHVSNVLGSVSPIARIAEHARRVGAWCVVDGVQAAPHLPVDVQALGCDAYVISGHKLYGPSGIGAVWARSEHWASAPPWQYGGDMVSQVQLQHAEFQHPPYRFEAGSPPVEGAIGLSAALDYLRAIGHDAIQRHEEQLLSLLIARLSELQRVRILGAPNQRVAVVSFNVQGVHPHDVGTVLDAHHVAVRTGQLCAAPALRRFGEHATVRASVGLYNTHADVEQLIAALQLALELFP